MLQHLVHGLTILGNGPSIIYLIGGTVVGVLFGVIPGLGGAVILSIALAFISHINLEGTLCVFLAVQAASYFSASMTSILLNTPAHPEAFAVTFDGFPMAQRGEPGRALGISACATCIGGLIGCVGLVGFIQILNELPGLFHAPDYVGLISLAMIMVGTLGSDSASKAIISMGLGLIIASVGLSGITGIERMTFGSQGLATGVSLVALALGLFAVPQMIMVFGTATTVARQDMMGNEVAAADPVALNMKFGTQVLGGVSETFGHPVALLRAGIVGVVTGIIPGIGGFTANFLSYGIAQQTSRKRDLFGTGIPEGIIAPEGSSISKEAGGLIPLLALGIPGSVGGALFLAALTLKGVRTGSGFTSLYPVLPFEMVWIMALSGILGTILGVILAPLLARVTKVPGLCLLPCILPITLVGVFISDQSYFSVGEAVIFGALGFILRRLRYSVASLAMGLVLGTTLENNIALTRELYPGVSFLERPLTDVLFLLTIVVLVTKTREIRKKNNLKRLASNSQDVSGGAGHFRASAPYPLFSTLFDASIVALSACVLVYVMTRYSLDTYLFPAIGAVITLLGGSWRLYRDLADFLLLRRSQGVQVNGDNGLAPFGPAEVRELEESPQTIAQSLALAESISALTTRTSVGSPERQARRGIPSVVEKAWGISGQYSRELFAMATYVVLAVGCYLFGFDVAIPIFCVLYGTMATRRVFRRALPRIAFAITIGLTMWASTLLIGVLHIPFEPIIH